jgi:hypothetical protein
VILEARDQAVDNRPESSENCATRTSPSW